MAKLDGEFHTLVGKASHNRVLQLAREPSELLVVSSTELILRKVKEGAPRLLQAHRMYVDALRRRDKDAGRLWVRRHLDDWRRGFERAGRDLDQPIDGLAPMTQAEILGQAVAQAWSQRRLETELGAWSARRLS